MPDQRIVAIPGVGNIAFPANMSNDDITRAIRTQIIPQAWKAKPEEMFKAYTTPEQQRNYQATSERLTNEPALNRAIDAATEFGQGALAGPFSTAAHFSDWARGGLASVSPAYKRALEEQNKKYQAATPEQRKRMTPAYYLKDPEAQKIITPPPTVAGQLGFGAEQMGEQLAAGALVPEVEGAGLLRGAARVGREALLGGAVTGAQTGSKEGAALGAGLGAAGGAVGEVARLKAPKEAERALEPLSKKLSLGERRGITERIVKPGAVVPLTKREAEAGFPSLEPEIARHRGLIQHLTTDPNSLYSQRTISIDSILQPVDRYIQRLARSDRSAAAGLAERRAQWAEELGYRPGKAATPPAQQPIIGANGQPLIDARGNPMMRTIPGAPAVPAVTTTTVAEAQRLKEAFRDGINASARGEVATPLGIGATTAKKLAEKGMKRSIETAIPEEPIRAINNVIYRDLRVKEAITAAMKRNPHWLRPTLRYVGGEGAVLLADRLTKKQYHGEAGGLEAATAAAWLIEMANRNPRVATRLLIALRGVAGPAFRGLGGPIAGAALSSGQPAPEASETTTTEAAPNRQRSGLTPERSQQVSAIAQQLAPDMPILPRLMRLIMAQESGGNQAAVSNQGAVGVMQIMPQTAAEHPGFDIHNEADNIKLGGTILKDLIARYRAVDANGAINKPNMRKAIAAYNAGPGAVDRRGGVPNYPETVAYVNKVMRGLGAD